MDIPFPLTHWLAILFPSLIFLPNYIKRGQLNFSGNRGRYIHFASRQSRSITLSIPFQNFNENRSAILHFPFLSNCAAFRESDYIIMCRFKAVQLFHIVWGNSQDIPRPNHRGLWDLRKSSFQKVPFFFCARAGIGNRRRTLNGTLENVNWISSEIPIGNSVAPVQAWRPQQNAVQRAIGETCPSEAPELFGQDFHIFWNSDSILRNLCSGYFGLLYLKSEIWVKQFVIILNG